MDQTHQAHEESGSSTDDIAEYVAHRLKLAGADKSVFAADAVSLMLEHATGALRDVDHLAHGATRDAARRKRKTADRDSASSRGVWHYLTNRARRGEMAIAELVRPANGTKAISPH